MEEFIISKENFNGLICIWGRDQDSPTTMNSLMCHVYNNDSLYQNKVNSYYIFFFFRQRFRVLILCILWSTNLNYLN